MTARRPDLSLTTPCGRTKSNKGKPFTVESIATHISQCRACSSILEAQVAPKVYDFQLDKKGTVLFEGVVLDPDAFDLLAYFAR